MKQERRAAGRLRVIAVTSGKGGVGKTNVSSNLAILAAKTGKRVLIIDGDLGLANVEILYGLTPRYCLGNLLDSSMALEEVLATGPCGVKVLPGGSGGLVLSDLDDAQKLKLVTALDGIEDSFDLVFVDSGAGIGENVLFFVGAAQEAVVVVNPEPTTLTDAYTAVKVLAAQGGVRAFNVVVNQCPSESQARDIFHRLSAVTSRFLDAKLRFLGSIPRDENIHRSVMAQKPIVELYPHSPASRALITIADDLLAETPLPNLDGGPKFLWNRLFRETEAGRS
jgi:flagellar biosynthesis protein FlhG